MVPRLKSWAFSHKLHRKCVRGDAFGVMASAVWPCYGGLSHIQHGMREIFGSIQVCRIGS